MFSSLPQDHWHVHADDPTALTRLLDLPDMIVTSLEYDGDHERLIVFCTHAFEAARCPLCHQCSGRIRDTTSALCAAWAGRASAVIWSFCHDVSIAKHATAP